MKFWKRTCTPVWVYRSSIIRGPRPSSCRTTFSTHILHSVVEGPLSLWVLFVCYSGIKEPTVQPSSALPQSSSSISSPQHHSDGQAAGWRKRENMRKMQRQKGRGQREEEKKMIRKDLDRRHKLWQRRFRYWTYEKREMQKQWKTEKLEN